MRGHSMRAKSTACTSRDPRSCWPTSSNSASVDSGSKFQRVQRAQRREEARSFGPSLRQEIGSRCQPRVAARWRERSAAPRATAVLEIARTAGLRQRDRARSRAITRTRPHHLRARRAGPDLMRTRNSWPAARAESPDLVAEPCAVRGAEQAWRVRVAPVTHHAQTEELLRRSVPQRARCRERGPLRTLRVCSSAAANPCP